MAFEVLNRLKWKGGLERCGIAIVHRGAPGDRKTIKGSQVTGTGRSYFYYRNEEGRETTIPMHRIREIRLDGKLVWERKQQPKGKD